MKSISQQLFSMSYSLSLFTIATIWKQANEAVFETCTMENNIAARKDEITLFAATWMELEIIIMTK